VRLLFSVLRLLGGSAAFAPLAARTAAAQTADTQTAAAPATAHTAPTRPVPAPRVGPATGAVVVVGGGAVGPETLARFIALAGGPDAIIVDVPTAGGDSVYPADTPGARMLRAAGARHVVVLHTVNRKVADADSFAAPLARAGGVWFDGGRQWHLVDSYAGTRTERAFDDVLARGGVVGGSSAGASILSSYLLRGARAGNGTIMAPGYERGFGFLRGVAIDQHVIARDRLPDLADSLRPAHPELLGISEDEGTAWVVRGDTADILGRSKAFVYGGADPTDPGRPFLTLYPGDRYDLGARRVVRRAGDGSPLTRAFVDSLFAAVAGPGRGAATVLVAQDGRVLADEAYGVPDQPRYLPRTTAPNFALGGMAAPLDSVAAWIAAHDARARPDERIGGRAYPQFVARRIFTPVGAHRTTVDTAGAFRSNVDELYRLSLAFDPREVRDTAGVPAPPDSALGWHADRVRGLTRLSAFATPDGRRGAFVRIPERRLTLVILTDRDDVDARGIADRIAERLLAPSPVGVEQPGSAVEVYAVRYGTLRHFPVAALVAGADTTRHMDIALMVWLVREPGPGGRRRTVLVDAGFYRDAFVRRWHPADYQRPSAALAALGVRPEDVTDLIISHVHWDHLDGADLFPNARVWIQRAEYEHHVDSAGRARDRAIDSTDAAMLARLRAAGRVTLLEGDSVQVLPGIVAYTGGRHTFASQYVSVATPHGTIVLASDNAYLYENLAMHAAIAQTLDPAANLAAQARMLRLAGDPRRIVPGHDPAVFVRFPAPGHGVARIE